MILNNKDKNIVENAEQAFIDIIAYHMHPTKSYNRSDFGGYLEAWLRENEEWNKAMDKMEEIIKEAEEARRTQ
jgi:hypothetical protein